MSAFELPTILMANFFACLVFSTSGIAACMYWYNYGHMPPADSHRVRKKMSLVLVAPLTVLLTLVAYPPMFTLGAKIYQSPGVTAIVLSAVFCSFTAFTLALAAWLKKSATSPNDPRRKR